jgi:hypothetical protein
MQVSLARLPLCAAGLVVIAAAAIAGCSPGTSSSGASSGAGASGSSSPAPANALDAVKLAAKTSSSANSFTGTMDLRATVKPGADSSSTSAGAVSMTATFAEQLHPSPIASVNIASLSSAGTSIPGGLAEIATPSTLYLKWSYLTQMLHLSKPWLAIPLSSLSQSGGVNLSQILGQATGSGPLAQSQLLQGATSVRQVGTGSVDGVPVTEYTGTLPLDKGISYLSGAAKAQLQQAMASAGFTEATFTVWVDGQHTVRKAVDTETGKDVTETITTTITSINQPVNIALPAAGQTSPLPGGDLSGLS